MAALPTQLRGERVKKAIEAYCELKEKSPEIERRIILQRIELKFDLTPLECEFLNRQLSEEGK